MGSYFVGLCRFALVMFTWNVSDFYFLFEWLSVAAAFSLVFFQFCSKLAASNRSIDNIRNPYVWTRE